ncbi:hypothetical protein [Paracoccus onubensis]|uniref:Uncharacterized protein n=1 Tax=Paracoccus onubensis TaxID=1675788 RepID=A0A418SQK0_9RHOB|nr:hypothetical protein [Paracoccus onubensis]RJE83233.1 hypothetical protein D3P04_17450 [Paracoccus onubensis]
MFAPEGFIPFDVVISQIYDASISAWACENTRRLDAGWKPTKGFALKSFCAREVLNAWMIARTINSYTIYAAAPHGQVMQISTPFLTHRDQLNWYDWEFPDVEGYSGELTVPFHRALENTDSLGKRPSNSDPFERFTFCDFHTSTIDVTEDRISRIAVDFSEEELSNLLRIVRNFDGWAICVKPDEFPKDIDELLSGIGFDYPRFEVNASNNAIGRKGRPQLQNIALEAYKLAYPNGHGSTHWSVVEDQIEEVAGRRISQKTIKRALDNNQDKMD